MMREYEITTWRMKKIVSLEQVARLAAQLKKQGKRLVTVNGSFDLLHVGHLDQLEEAKQQGDVLFVGLNSDDSVREEKGESRPFIEQEPRAALLAALECVDYVIIIDASYAEVPGRLLRAVKPQVHVNGPDYGEPETWLEWPILQEIGAEGHTVARRNDFSTSALIKKIRSAVSK